MNSIGYDRNSYRKILAAPVVRDGGLRLSNFFLEEILRFAAQILGFLRWHPPKILRSSPPSRPTPQPVFFKLDQFFLLIQFTGFIVM